MKDIKLWCTYYTALMCSSSYWQGLSPSRHQESRLSPLWISNLFYAQPPVLLKDQNHLKLASLGECILLYFNHYIYYSDLCPLCLIPWGRKSGTAKAPGTWGTNIFYTPIRQNPEVTEVPRQHHHQLLPSYGTPGVVCCSEWLTAFLPFSRKSGTGGSKKAQVTQQISKQKNSGQLDDTHTTQSEFCY